MKSDSKCFVDARISLLVDVLKDNLTLRHGIGQKPNLQQYVIFDLLKRLGFASCHCDLNNTLAWTITPLGEGFIEELVFEDNDEAEEDKGEVGDTDVHDAACSPLAASAE